MQNQAGSPAEGNTGSYFLEAITRIKNPDEMLAEAKSEGLEKTLGVWDLIILGVGAIIGSGIFAVVGIAAAGSADGSSLGAGPALMVSMCLVLPFCSIYARFFKLPSGMDG